MFNLEAESYRTTQNCASHYGDRTSGWKQPVYYELDKAMTKEVLMGIIYKLYDVCFTVVATVSDLRGSSQSALKVSPANPPFKHPANDDLLIFSFADVPGHLKLFRNHFLDEGFIINGKTVSKRCVQQLLSVSATELRVAHKMS